MKFNSKLLKSRYSLFVLVAIIAITVFMFTRGCLFILSKNEFQFNVTNLFFILGSGFLYDIAFITYFILPAIYLNLFISNKFFHRKLFRYANYFALFCIFSGLYFVIVAEFLFWDEFSVRFNFISVDYLIYAREVSENIYQSYPIIRILIFLGFLSSGTVYALKKKFLDPILLSEDSLKTRITVTISVSLLAIIFMTFLGQDLRESVKNNYVKELGSNGPYQFVAAFRNNHLDYNIFYAQGNDEELSTLLKKNVAIKNPQKELYNISRDINNPAKEEKLNVILISIESLSAKYITRFGNTEEDVTPFMDKWFKKSLLFTNFYATGTRTTRGLESITLSIPPTPGRSIVKRPNNSKMFNLGKVFKDNGYSTTFLYGGRGYFDNMNAFFSGNGYSIVDQNTIPSNEIDFSNAWGVSDEVLYKQVIKEADNNFKAKKPFFFHVLTTSNHRPYTYPKGKIDIPSGKGRRGAVKYTDYALNQLLNNAQTKKWFKNTIFVILADHCAGSAGKIGLPIKKYHIPFFIYSPKWIQPGEIAKLSSQIDLAPTVLNIVGLSYKSQFFGQNILQKNFKERALIGNYQKLGLYENDVLTILSTDKKIYEIENPQKNQDVLKIITPETNRAKKTMSYYQGAEFILKHRLNRYKD